MERAPTGKPTRQTGSVDWLFSQNASILNDGTSTCVNRGPGGLSTPDNTVVSNVDIFAYLALDLGSDHLPITPTIRCEVPAAPSSKRRACWNIRNTDWNQFSAAVEEAIELFSTAPLLLGDRVHLFNSALLAKEKLHVRGRSLHQALVHSEFGEAIKNRNARTVTSNRAEQQEACAATCKLSEEARQKKWEEFLADLEYNPDPDRMWRTIKSLP